MIYGLLFIAGSWGLLELIAYLLRKAPTGIEDDHAFYIGPK
jgi:hypothetical protein